MGNAYGRGADCQDLNEQGNKLTSANRFAEGRRSYEQAIDLARRSGDLECEMQAQGNLGVCCWTEKKYAEAAEHYDLALNIARTIGDRDTEALSLQRLVMAHAVLNNVEQGIKYSGLALRLEEEMGNVSRKASVLGTLAALYARSGLPFREKAVETFEGALKQARSSGNRQVESGIEANYMGFLQSIGRTRKYAPEEAEAEREVAGYVLQSSGPARHNMEEGNRYLSQGETGRAHACYREASNAYKRELVDHRGDPLALSKLMSDLGVVAVKLGNGDESARCFDSALKIAETTYDRDTCSLIQWNHGLLICEQGNVRYGLEKMRIRIIFETDFDLPTLESRQALMSELRKKA